MVRPPLQACLQVGDGLYGAPHMRREAVLKAPRECGMWERRESAKRETALIIIHTGTGIPAAIMNPV